MTHDDAITTLAAERYLLDEMSEIERHEFEEHYFDCDVCAADLRTAARMSDRARAALPMPADDADSARRPKVVQIPPRWSAAALAPFAAAAMLALVAGYQTFVAVPALRSRLAPQFVTPVILTPTTRGEAPVVPLSESSPLVLSLDVNLTPSSGQLVYDVRQDAGEVVATGRRPAPLPGTPLILILADAPTPGLYVVTLREAEGAGARESTYRFTIR
jgi:anti-sigma factor RsiW